MRSLDGRPDLTTTTERLSPQLASERLSADGANRTLAVDVRAPNERRDKAVEGSVGIPLNHLTERLSELPKDRPLLVYCAGGYRSSIAASLLQQHGYQVSELAGGIAAWESARLPVTSTP